MIDLAISEDGTVLLVHDKGTLGRIAGIDILEDGLVRVTVDHAPSRDLKHLTPQLHRMARASRAAQVVELDGYEIVDAYPCPLDVRAEGR